MGSKNREISRYEVTAVYTHPEAKADIVLVHGLNGEPDMTWTKDGTFWPLDLLPTALRGTHANILVYGYNADVYSKGYDRTTSNHFINQHAEDLVTNLTLHRRSQETSKNPIIWVCHSLGGILVKRALLYSHDVRGTHLEDLGSIYVSTFGLIFLGTPYVGSDTAAWGVMIQAMANALIPKRFFDSEPVLLKTLRKDNETLVNISSHFLDIYQRFEIHMVRENQKTDIKGKRFFVVDANSAAPPLPGVTYYGIEANHADMCKYDSVHSPGFRNIAITLREWIEKAPLLIQRRWCIEEEEGRNRAIARVNEIMRRQPSQRSSRVSHEENEPQFAGRTSHFIEDMPIQEYRCSSLSHMIQHVRNMSKERTEENPFPGASYVPSMDIANTNCLYQYCGLIHRSRHSEASLNTGPGYWAPDLPINTNSASCLCPLPGYPHRCTLITEGTEMIRSRSEGIQFNGNVGFGQSEHRSPQTVHPSEIESPPPENQDTRQEGMKSQPPDYSQS
ncbi:Alpha/Beta hydrolase protein [Fusarium venenatum]|uniref:Alpha/Beta hydrolase protein n=1 Tax=Fusarium venenatum TaxID=56646 RepID=UPI001D84DE5A|nr:Alpha/Beta hydrolase protein [Fusarium venenatum]